MARTRYNATYIPGIDGLRAVAVLAVIVFHLDADLLPGGFTGVDVFFVISGYVISRSLAGGAASGFGTFLVGFYKRRILRIFPALLVCLGITSLASSLFIPESWLSSSNEGTALWAFFGLSNFFLIDNADGYFSDRVAFNPFMHTWSLAVEEQFYLFFPLLFHLWLRNRGGSGRRHAATLALLPVVALLSLVLAAVETNVAHQRAFYLLPSRFWELAAGVMLFQAQHYRPSLGATAGRWLMPAGVLLLAIGFAATEQTHFPFPWALLPVTGALLVITATTTAHTEGSVHALLRSAPVTYVGRISYSLYLWHWAVFVLFRWTVGLSQPLNGALALMLTLLLSILSYHLVENGFRRNALLRRQPSWRIVSGGLATISAAFLATGLLFKYDRPAGLNLSASTDPCIWGHSYRGRCRDQSAARPSSVSSGTPRKLLVVGDSHAGAYEVMARFAAARLGAQAQVLRRSGCPIAKLIHAAGDNPACRNYEHDALSWIAREAHPGDIVFLASLRLHRLSNQWGSFDEAEIFRKSRSPEQAAVRERALAETIQLVSRLHAMGLHVLIDAPKPIFRAPPFRCGDWFNAQNPVCAPGFEMPRKVLLRHREPVMAALHILQRDHGVYLWDPFPILCPGPVCSAFDGDKPLFMDGDHLSGYGDRQLLPSFTSELATIWSGHGDGRRQVGRTSRAVQPGG